MAEGEPKALQHQTKLQEGSQDDGTASNNKDSSRQTNAEQLEALIAQATAKYAVKDYRSAAELYSRATELQAEINGEMSPQNAELLYSYGRCLYHVAVLNSEVLGSKLAGEAKDNPAKPTNSNRVSGPKPKGTKDAESVKTQEMITELVEEKQTETNDAGDSTDATKPYFVFTGDDGYDESDEEGEEPEEGAANADEDEDDDDFSNAFEVLDLARILLQRQLEDQKQSASANVVSMRQVEERLADTFDLQAEISLEGEQFSNAATDLQASLAMKQKLYPFESSLVAEAHYKLSLALEFSAVTHPKDGDGEIDSSKPAVVDPQMRSEAAEQMEKAIASCNARIMLETKKLAEGANPDEKGKQSKIQQQSINDVKEMVVDMEQRLKELREAPVTVNDPRGTGDPDGSNPLNGVLGEILGESPEAQKARIEEAIQSANDLTSLVKRKRKADDTDPGTGNATPEKRARTEETEG